MQYKVKFWKGTQRHETPAEIVLEAGSEEELHKKLKGVIGWGAYNAGNYEVLDAPEVVEEKVVVLDGAAEEAVEPAVGPFTCADCGKETRTEVGLKRHVTKTHKE